MVVNGVDHREPEAARGRPNAGPDSRQVVRVDEIRIEVPQHRCHAWPGRGNHVVHVVTDSAEDLSPVKLKLDSVAKKDAMLMWKALRPHSRAIHVAIQ